jgi:hypothetical protein
VTCQRATDVLHERLQEGEVPQRSTLVHNASFLELKRNAHATGNVVVEGSTRESEGEGSGVLVEVLGDVYAKFERE